MKEVNLFSDERFNFVLFLCRAIILPFENLGGEEFNYPSGVNDLRDYTGESFDLDAYKEVAKFYTAGSLEGTLNEFSGSLKDPEQREAVRNVFGTGLLER